MTMTTTATATDRSGGRRYDLDALRVLAVLLLVPFHTARVFDTFDTFYVKHPETSAGLSWAVVAFLNPWHMPLLFVLAGAATWLALGHRAPGAYLGERTRRLLVPFLFGLLVVVPPQAYLATRFRGHHPSAGAFLRDYWTIDGDLTGYSGSFTPGHLWFIGSLFLLSITTLPLLARWRRRPPPSRWLLVAMPLLLAGANELPAPTDGPQSPWYALALFLAGFLLLADPRTEPLLRRHRRPLAVTAALTMATLLLVWRSGVEDRLADGSAADVGLALLEQVNTWVWVLALLAAAATLLGNRSIPGLRYASEASFPCYVLHQTVIVAVAYAVVGRGLGAGPSFVVIALASTALTLGLYELAVRRADPTRLLFGMKPRRRPAADLEPRSRVGV